MAFWKSPALAVDIHQLLGVAFKLRPPGPDKLTVGRFLHDAEQILETAEAASALEPANFIILIGPEGDIHMLSGSDWPLDSLQVHYGARTLYRVSRAGGRVSVEGRSGSQHCRLESESPRAVARRLLGGPTIPLLDNV